MSTERGAVSRDAVHELELRHHLLVLFPQEEFEVAEEVRLRSKRMDFLFRARNGKRRTTAVEMKVSDWRRGLWQAVTYKLAADYVYLALWKSSAKRVPLDSIRGLKVGLIEVRDEGAHIVLVAPRSDSRRRELAREVERGADFG
jgi:hypothetical protein